MILKVLGFCACVAVFLAVFHATVAACTEPAQSGTYKNAWDCVDSPHCDWFDDC
jgi:hypothetical protein